MLRSNLSDHNDAYIVLKQRASVTGTDNTNRRDKNQNFKNNVIFRSYITKINNTFIDISWYCYA